MALAAARFIAETGEEYFCGRGVTAAELIVLRAGTYTRRVVQEQVRLDSSDALAIETPHESLSDHLFVALNMLSWSSSRTATQKHRLCSRGQIETIAVSRSRCQRRRRVDSAHGTCSKTRSPTLGIGGVSRTWNTIWERLQEATTRLRGSHAGVDAIANATDQAAAAV